MRLRYTTARGLRVSVAAVITSFITLLPMPGTAQEINSPLVNMLCVVSCYAPFALCIQQGDPPITGMSYAQITSVDSDQILTPGQQQTRDTCALQYLRTVSTCERNCQNGG
jgi:hypothetical protein